MTSIMLRNFSYPVSPCPNISEFLIDTDAIADTALRTNTHRKMREWGQGVMARVLFISLVVQSHSNGGLEGSCGIFRCLFR